MSDESDRIAVPTNGRKRRKVPAVPPSVIEVAGVPTSDVVARRAVTSDPAADPANDPATRAPMAKATSPELTIAVTPAQLAVGFGVVAGIILLLLGRRRARRTR